MYKGDNVKLSYAIEAFVRGNREEASSQTERSLRKEVPKSKQAALDIQSKNIIK